jgi:hypothetical protein
MITHFLTDHKALFATAAIAFSIIGFIPYLKSILEGQTKPHICTWFIWSLTMIIAFAAQLNDGAHMGAYHTGFSALICLFVCALAYKHGEKEITRSDAASLVIALSALPIWLITDNALYAILIVLSIDLLGFYPTIRKSIRKPYEENALAYFIAAFSFTMAIAAIENYSLTTTVYPLVIMLMNIGFPLFLLFQRRRRPLRV